MATQQNLHIGQLIKSVFDESGLSVAEFARRINCGRPNVYSIFERSTIDVKQLVAVCKALNHNFLNDIATRCEINQDSALQSISINLNITDLDDVKATKVARFLNELNDLDRQ